MIPGGKIWNIYINMENMEFSEIIVGGKFKDCVEIGNHPSSLFLKILQSFPPPRRRSILSDTHNQASLASLISLCSSSSFSFFSSSSSSSFILTTLIRPIFPILLLPSKGFAKSNSCTSCSQSTNWKYSSKVSFWQNI